MIAVFKTERPTKNTYKFAEVLESECDAAKVGSVYVQKFALKDMDFNPEDEIVMTLEVKKKAK